MRGHYLTFLSLSIAALACSPSDSIRHLPDAPPEPDASIDTPMTFTLAVVKDGNGTGTVASDQTGLTCGDDCSEGYAAGTAVTLTATPDPGTTFVGWVGGGCTGTGPCVVTVIEATQVTASFALNNSLVLTRAGNGAGTVTSAPAGIDCGTTCSASFAYGAVVTLTARPATGSTFTGWTGGGCTGTVTCTTTMTAAVGVTARFTLQQFTLGVTKVGNGAGTVTSNPVGINCGPTCSAPFNFNQTVTLTAAPATGSTFAGWTGGCTGTATCTTTITGAVDVMARFTLQRFTLSVNFGRLGPDPRGTVTSSPAGINCTQNCAADFNFNQLVTLTAVPGFATIFTGWSGGGCSGTGTCSVAIIQATTVTASFLAAEFFLLTVTFSGDGAGTVTSSPAGIDCDDTCVGSFRPSTTVTLTPAANPGSRFQGWIGGGCESSFECIVTMNAGNLGVTAVFASLGTATGERLQRGLNRR